MTSCRSWAQVLDGLTRFPHLLRLMSPGRRGGRVSLSLSRVLVISPGKETGHDMHPSDPMSEKERQRDM